MILAECVVIAAKPEAIYRFFDDMEQNYLRWHPDHVLFRWVSGRGVGGGNAFHFDERINGKLLKKTVVFTHVVPNRHIEFAPTLWLLRLFLPRMIFRIEEQTTACLFTAEIHLRIGPLAARLNRRDLDAVRQHMKEEGQNIKRLLEAPGSLSHEP